MKYNELSRLLRRAGCYPLGETRHGHPLWYSPMTGREFQFSHHGKEEVARGTLRAILVAAGIK